MSIFSHVHENLEDPAVGGADRQIVPLLVHIGETRGAHNLLGVIRLG